MSGTELSASSRGLLEVIFQANVAGEPARQSWKHPIIKELERKDLIAGDGGIDSDNRQSYTVTDKGAAMFGGWPEQKDETQVDDAMTHDGAAEPAPETATSEPTAVKTRQKRVAPPPPQHSAVRFSFSAFKTPRTERKPRGEEYPFAGLGEPQEPEEEDGEMLLDSFFIAKTDEQPNPGKYMASAVGSANKRYEGKAKFAVRTIKNDPEFGVDGARVFRVE